jgi:hypothetical protein
VNKGQFQKGNQAAAKRGENKQRSYYATITQPKQIERKETETNLKDYIRFGDDNLFPQKTIELYRRSAVNRAVINSKRNYIAGAGFSSEDERLFDLYANTSETLEDVLKKLVLDDLITGNSYIEIVKGNGFAQLYHVDSSKCRYSLDKKSIIMHPDWAKYEQNKKLSKVLPLYPTFERVDGAMRSIYHIKSYEPEFNTYGIPSNIAGWDSSIINYKTNRWNINRIENSFSLSGVLNVKANFSQEDAEAFVNDIKDAFTGEGKNGKVLPIVDELGAENGATSFTPIAQNDEGNWLQLHQRATEEIIIANQWFSSLAGLNVGTGFDTNRIINDYNIAINTIIPTHQQVFIEVFYKLIKENLGLDFADLTIINKKPVKDYTGLNNVLIAIMQKVSEGVISEDMAKASIKMSYQLTDEEIDKLWGN